MRDRKNLNLPETGKNPACGIIKLENMCTSKKVGISGRNRTCQPGRITPHPDVQPGPTTRQTPFSGRGDALLSGHTVAKFRRPAVLQLNIEGLTASKMNILYHLAVQYEATVSIFQDTHCSCTDMPMISGFALAGSSLSRKHDLATFVRNGLK